MSVFYFVRHAHANWIPDENRPLSEQGMKDALRIVGALRPFPISAIYASPYQRTSQTIEPFARQADLPIQILPDLRERLLAKEPVEDLEEPMEFEEAVEAVWQNPNFAHPGGESNRVAQRRGVAAVELLRAKHPADHVVLATHGNLMALILQHFDPTLGYEFWKSLQMPDVYRLSLDTANQASISTIENW